MDNLIKKYEPEISTHAPRTGSDRRGDGAVLRGH